MTLAVDTVRRWQQVGMITSSSGRCFVVTKNKVRRGGKLGFGIFNESHAPNVGYDLAGRHPFRRMRSSRKLKHRGMLADA